MGQIQRLDEAIADKIAAGEVIERPLSVVKELLENSLDAGADFIDIEIQDGGTRLIRLKDNGKGMDGEDLSLAFQRHATSKIHTFQDVYQLHTFGFRGEALPSIAAVAQVEMVSCTAEEPIGHRIQIHGGVVQSFSEEATAKGTVIEVKNLFYNIPARRKFLKSSSHEAGLIGDLISKYAMGHPQVRFRYVSNQQMQLDTAGLQCTEQCMAYVYGSNLEPLIVTVPKKELAPGRWLEAWLVREEMTRNNRSQEVFFVNDRLIKSSELSQTLEESYYTLIAKGRFPIAVIKLTFPGEELDVNIHPAKTEIKMHNFESLKPKIIEYLRDALWEANITKNAFLPESIASSVPKSQIPTVSEVVSQQNQQHTPITSPKESMVGATKTSSASFQNKEVEDTKDANGQRKQASPVSTEVDIIAEPEKLYQYKQSSIPKNPPKKTDSVIQDALFSVTEKKDLISDSNDTVVDFSKETTLKQNNKDNIVIGQNEFSVQVKGIKNLTVIGQLNQSFILAQNEEGLYIIDQHTCHERILYEKFMKAEAEKEVLSQPLLIPVTVHLSAQQDALLMQHIFTLQELGFSLEHFGDRCYLLRSLPFGLNDLPDIETLFLDLLHDLGEQRQVTAAGIKEKILITASCKGAVKAHWPLTEIEMRTLLHDLSQVENAHTCPHGRPIIYKITMQELYKIFKRGTYYDEWCHHRK